ncbi:unnamed protein product, partial [Ectocarpus sp. 8 AP-2014]
LEEANEDLREELSELKGRVEHVEGPAVMELEEEVSRLQKRCDGLTEEVERLTAERDKLMDIGNSLRAELNRALSNSFEKHGDRNSATDTPAAAAEVEERTAEKVNE